MVARALPGGLRLGFALRSFDLLFVVKHDKEFLMCRGMCQSVARKSIDLARIFNVFNEINDLSD